MKKYTRLFLLVLLVVAMLTGCRANVPQDTSGNIVSTSTTVPTTNNLQTEPSQTNPSQITETGTLDTQSGKILAAIWEKYGEQDRFAAYGGTLDKVMDGGPGDMNMQNTEELTTKYLLPENQLANVSEGASLVHMMNSNIFTAAVVKIASGADVKALHEAWRDAIQSNRWICGQPDRLLLAKVDEEHLLMAFGSTEAMELFSKNLKLAHEKAQILYHEAVVV